MARTKGATKRTPREKIAEAKHLIRTAKLEKRFARLEKKVTQIQKKKKKR
jgi:hypothetical protein